MPHVFSHNITAYGGRRSQHDEDGYHFFIPETERRRYGKQKGGLDNQLY